MTAADRPSLAKKSTASAALRRQKELDAQTFGVRIDGVDYVLNPVDITGVVEYKIRERIGYGLAELFDLLQRSPGADLIGKFMWGVRLAHGEDDLDLMDVLAGINHGSEVAVMTKAETKAVLEATPKA